MNIHIKLFGLLADSAGRNEIILSGINNTDALKHKLFCDFPQLKNKSFVIAIGTNICNNNQQLNDNDTVALLPPFAGG